MAGRETEIGGVLELGDARHFRPAVRGEVGAPIAVENRRASQEILAGGLGGDLRLSW